jgi:hypothetical protein
MLLRMKMTDIDLTDLIYLASRCDIKLNQDEGCRHRDRFHLAIESLIVDRLADKEFVNGLREKHEECDGGKKDSEKEDSEES